MRTVSAAGSLPRARVDDADVRAPAVREPQRGGRLLEPDVGLHEVNAPTLVVAAELVGLEASPAALHVRVA